MIKHHKQKKERTKLFLKESRMKYFCQLCCQLFKHYLKLISLIIVNFQDMQYEGRIDCETEFLHFIVGNKRSLLIHKAYLFQETFILNVLFNLVR